MPHKKTSTVAKELGISYGCLAAILRTEKMTRPAKDESGDYIWTPADIAALRAAKAMDFRRKEYKKIAQDHYKEVQRRHQAKSLAGGMPR